MGYIVHEAILAVGVSDEWETAAARWAGMARRNDVLAPFVIGPITGINFFTTVGVAPTGSKSGWPPSDAAELLRDQLKELCDQYEGAEWVEVSWGGDFSHESSPQMTSNWQELDFGET